jgi:hypothetical protein
MSELTQRIAGKQVAAVLTNGHVLQLRMRDGSEVDIAWVDGDGRPLKGKPVLLGSGVRLMAAGIRDLIHLPGARRVNIR